MLNYPPKMLLKLNLSPLYVGMLSLGGRIHKTCQICSLTTLILKFIIYKQYNLDKVYIISNPSKLSINLMSNETYLD